MIALTSFLRATTLILVMLCSMYACTPKKKAQTKLNDTYAQYFRVIKHQDHTEIQILNPDTGKADKRLALASNIQNLQLDRDVIPIQTPLQSIITLNGTDIGMLAKLKCIDLIKGVSNATYVYNAQLKKALKQGKVAEFGDFNQMNPEKILAISSVITYSGFGTPPANEDKLRQLGVVCIPMYDWREKHPLGKTEWIKLLGHLMGKEKQADTYLKKTVKLYKEQLLIAKRCKTRPVVLSGALIGDTWFMPAGQSFNALLFKQAGCQYVAQAHAGTGSAEFSFEEVYSRFKNADIWINPMFSSEKQLLGGNSKYAYFKAFQKKQVYCYSHNMNNFWENSAIEPHKVLSDLIQIFHASEVGKSGIPKKKLYFYRKIQE